MNSVSFPSCCGINLMINFGHTHTAIYNGHPTKKQIQQFIKKNIEFDKRIPIIVLNSEQLKAIKRSTFTELGFKIQLLGLYTGHMNKLYLITKKP